MIQSKVKELYEQYPYPLDKRAFLRYSNDVTELDMCSRENWSVFRNERILDFGCGTGEIACGMAKRLPGCDFIGIDISSASLKYANQLREIERLSNVQFVQGDLAKVSEYEHFNRIISVGVIHHTYSAGDSFAALASAVTVGGNITVALYSAYGRLWNRIKRFFIRCFVGNDINKIMKFINKFHKGKLSETELVRLADRYAHPQETYFTIGDVFSWYKNNGIEYIGSYPPFELPYYPKLMYLTWKLRKRSLAERDRARFEYLKKTPRPARFWNNAFFYFIVQLLWMFLLKSSLFFSEGKKNKQ